VVVGVAHAVVSEAPVAVVEKKLEAELTRQELDRHARPLPAFHAFECESSSLSNRRHSLGMASPPSDRDAAAPRWLSSSKRIGFASPARVL
jgi:hypothetical protein